MKRVFLYVIFSFLVFISAFAGRIREKQWPANRPVKVYVCPLQKEIGPAAWRIVKKGFAEAELWHADLVLIHMNTYGGSVDAADSIRTKILNSPVPVYVFIDNNAASAGALISIAADRIYMRPGATIGAATVVNQSGQAMPDKYQSYMRGMIRATAEAHGKDTLIDGKDTVYKWKRDPLIAEAMVDPRTYIKNLNDTGKVLTLTTNEAIKWGFCEGNAETVRGVLAQAGINHYSIREFKLTALESIIGFLMNPLLQAILIMIIVGGIYFEFQSPGLGFPIVMAILSAVLYFAPLYLEGLAENWEVLVFIAGLILIALEVFVVPGFGVTGISGITLTIAGLTLSLVDNGIFKTGGIYPVYVILRAFSLVCMSMFVSFLLSLWASKKLFTSSRFENLALNTSQDKELGYTSYGSEGYKLVGKTGVAHTVLRPSGKVIVDDEVYDAKSEIGFVEKGQKVKVVRFETGQVYVRKE